MRSVKLSVIGMAALVVMLASDGAAAADRWPEWRGADGQGRSTASDVPLRWGSERNIAWKTEIPGLGWSTPVVNEQHVWLTTAIDERASEEEVARRRKLTDNSQPLIFSSHVSLRAVCVDRKTGKLIDSIEVLSEDDPQFIHFQNSYATPTPILDGDRLYCHYGPSGMACLDLRTKKVLWTNRSLRVKHENGPGSSPVLWKDRIIIHCDGIDEQYITAIDTRTGETAWKTERSGKLHANPQLRKAYATPLVIEVEGQPQIISPAADWVYGYDPATGKELWRYNYGQLGFSNSPRPVAGNGVVYICTGYMKSQLLAIRPGTGERKPELLWTFAKQVPAVSSPLLVGEQLYFGSDRGVATCLDAASGDVLWTERLGKQFWASPIFAEGRVYFPDRTGAITVVAAERDFKKLAVNRLDGTLFSAPAAVNGALFLRTDKALYCIR